MGVEIRHVVVVPSLTEISSSTSERISFPAFRAAHTTRICIRLQAHPSASSRGQQAGQTARSTSNCSSSITTASNGISRISRRTSNRYSYSCIERRDSRRECSSFSKRQR